MHMALKEIRGHGIKSIVSLAEIPNHIIDHPWQMVLSCSLLASIILEASCSPSTPAAANYQWGVLFYQLVLLITSASLWTTDLLVLPFIPAVIAIIFMVGFRVFRDDLN